MKTRSEYGKIGIEQGQAGQRIAFRAAVRGSRGDIQHAADTLGMHRGHMAREAARLGLDWEALLAEARALDSDPPETNAA